MEDAPLPTIMTPKESFSESFEIKLKEQNYKLNIIIINQDITLNLLNEKEIMKEYEIKLTLNELDHIHKIFSLFNSAQEFVDFMKTLNDNKKLSIKQTDENKISIEFSVEYLFKQNTIKIDLLKKKVNFELIAQDLYKKISLLTENYKILDINYKKVVEENEKIKEENKKIKEENEKIKEENKKMKEENENIKNRITNLENIINSSKNDIIEIKDNNNRINSEDGIKNLINSIIMKTKDEFDMVASAIKQKMNKEIKEIKKLYQATKDGEGDPAIFHQKCDNIPNTLVLYNSAGNRRFGAFVSICWKTEGVRTIDKNCFSFSLDKKKIYYGKNKDNYEIAYYKKEGPNICMNNFLTICITGNPLKTPCLRTGENRFKNIFGESDNALSEDGKYKGIYAKEYEVFQIIF